MKIKKLATIVLMITLFIILGTKVYAETGTINEETVKLRKEPNSSTILDYVYEGDKVEILELEDGWYKVKATTELGKVTGYISEEFIDAESEKIEQPKETEDTTDTETPVDATENNENITTDTTPAEDIVVDIFNNNAEDGKQYILSQEVKIKALPLINSIEKATISGDIKVIEIINDWSRIENDTESGWIRTKTLEKLLTTSEVSTQKPETPQEDQEPTTNDTIPEETTKAPETEEPSADEEKINKVGYVSTDGLRVRKGPSTDTEEIDSLEKNDKVKIIGQSGKWYKIDLDGKIGYVSAKYISETKVAETTSRSGSTIRNEVVTNTETVQKQEETTNKPEITPEPEKQVEVQEPVVPEQPATSTKGNEVVEYAKQYLGYKYVSGGASPSKGFDCSGFTTFVYKHFGVSLNRSSRDQIKNGTAVAKADLQPGDLVIFNNDANTSIGHVGIYIGDGNFIHASNPKDGVKITTLLSGYYKIRYVGARRVI